MAAMHEAEELPPRECANCGATEALLRCSRCHGAFFCGVKCQKAYWPFHRSDCYRNEFADQIENREPKFARWMRSHRKLAVLKDDEVDRLERASKAAVGDTREDVMDSMYGRLIPKPAEPKYSGEDIVRMRRRDEDLSHMVASTSADMLEWKDITVPESLGMDCDSYKWYQNQTYVEVHALLKGCQPSKVALQLTTTHLSIVLDTRPLLSGELHSEIKSDASTWYIENKILHIIMMKRNRRGSYASGSTNADTFWFSPLQKGPAEATIPVQHPPTSYYSSYAELENGGPLALPPPRSSHHNAQQNSIMDITAP
ncbi:hypothetical protein WJX74_001619 [Apatococcus lobatus]|uniref:MYND-type domain-containing protein n=1 Tax=Apatococcus lobatus TaxID=904363 RepID=A0AAW1RRT6_9CHLO